MRQYNCTTNETDQNQEPREGNDVISATESTGQVCVNFTDVIGVGYICLTPEDATSLGQDILLRAQEAAAHG